jgi:hypothetical protein
LDFGYGGETATSARAEFYYEMRPHINAGSAIVDSERGSGVKAHFKKLNAENARHLFFKGLREGLQLASAGDDSSRPKPKFYAHVKHKVFNG